MNKRKRVAHRKHRIKRKKIQEKRRREKALPGRQPGSGGRGESAP
jgi:hypothetical protein